MAMETFRNRACDIFKFFLKTMVTTGTLFYVIAMDFSVPSQPVVMAVEIARQLCKIHQIVLSVYVPEPGQYVYGCDIYNTIVIIIMNY